MKTIIRMKAAFAVVLFMMVSVTAKALDPVMYIDKDGKEQWVTDYKVITGYETVLTKGWYVIKGEIFTGDDITRAMSIEVRGNVHIILMDNCLFHYDSWWGFVDGKEEDAFNNFSTLNIYSQSFGDKMGRMVMKLGNRYAFNTYKLNIYGGNFDITDVGSTGYAIHSRYVSIWNGKINIHGKPSMSVGVLKLYGGEITCRPISIDTEVIFGQSSVDLVCNFEWSKSVSDIFKFSGTSRTVTIEDGVVLTIGDKTYTERIPWEEFEEKSYGINRDFSLTATSKTNPEVLAIDAVTSNSLDGKSGWFTLNGTRLNAQPEVPGIYIKNGKKVVVR